MLVARFFRNARNGIPSKKQLSLFKETLLHLLSERWNSDEKEHLRQWLCYIGDAHRLATFATSACPAGIRPLPGSLRELFLERIFLC